MVLSPNDPIGLLLDQEGYFINPKAWNPEVARMLARRMGFNELNEDHWKILWHIRTHFLKNGTLPAMHHVCKANDLDDDAWHELFTHGPVEAWKIAGLPDPGIEARTYLGNESW